MSDQDCKKGKSFKLAYLGASKRTVMEVLWSNGAVKYHDLMKLSRLSWLEARSAFFFLRSKRYIDVYEDGNGDNLYTPAIAREEYEGILSRLVSMFSSYEDIDLSGIPDEHRTQLEKELLQIIARYNHEYIKDLDE